MIPFVIGAFGNITKEMVPELGYKKTSRDHPDSRIIEIGQNTEMSPENLRRVTVTLGMTSTWLRNGNFPEEIEYLLIAAQNNIIRTNYIKAKID